MYALAWVDEWLSWIAPDHCQDCGAAEAADGLCRACAADLPWNHSACPRCAQPTPAPALCPRCQQRPPAFDSAYAPFVLADPIRGQIPRFKYQARFDIARPLCARMVSGLAQRALPLPDVLVPVPMAYLRTYWRGYNQALLIARTLARGLNVRLLPAAVQMLRIPVDQIGQSAPQRRRNLRNVFRFRRRLDGHHVALVDDVMTTGATLDALAQAARKAGATRIEAWALARTP